MAADKESDLSRCPEVLAEITARVRTNEIFTITGQKDREDQKPRGRPEKPWPMDAYAQLDSDSIPMELTKNVPKSSYLMKKKAAVYTMAAYRAMETFKTTDINVIRELMARCPVLLENLKDQMKIWEWMERTSGLYIDSGVDGRTQLGIVRGLLTTLVWKVKESVREGAIVGAEPEPLMDLKHLQDKGVDIAYDPTWKRGQQSYAKDKIEPTAAENFAKAVTTSIFKKYNDPYTMAGRCPGCDEGVAPGTLAQHIKTCSTTNPPGYRIDCPDCGMQFKEIKYLAQHRALHCRDDQDLCDACGFAKKCACRKRRQELCVKLKELILEESSSHSDSIFDLDNVSDGMATDKEIKTVCNLLKEEEPPSWGMRTLENTLEALGLEPKKEKPKPVTICQECGHDCKTASSLAIHMDTHRQICEYCEFTTTSESDMEEHREQYHYPCSACTYVADTVQDLQEHTLQCEVINSKKTTRYGEAESNSESESDTETIKEQKTQKDDKKKEKEGEKGPEHKCDKCKTGFMNKDDLLVHWDENPSHRMVMFRCGRCTEEFDNSGDLLDHTRRNHRSEGENPLWCPICVNPVKENKYLQHLKKHKELWAWCKGGVPCQHCHTRSDTVALALEHLLNFHRTQAPDTLMELKRHLETDEGAKHGLVVATKRLAREATDIKCQFEGCGRTFYDKDQLTAHRPTHQCSMCDYIGRSPKDLSDHQDKHGKVTPGGKRDNNFTCEKCGMKLATMKELTEHKETHKIHQCGTCKGRFTSKYLADKHELTCSGTTSTDMFEASRSSDPLLVVMNSLGQLVNTFNKSGTMDDDVTGILKDQLRKAKNNHSAGQTFKKNHQVQRTWTFLKAPTFTPSNVINHYNEKDVAELKGKEFAGDKTPEENYTRLQALTTAVGRVVKSKLITKDVATDLLMQHLKAPAANLANHYKENFEQEHGDTAVPEYEDILILLEQRYIRIKPLHAREQLNAMSKGESESITDFFDRAWRCSHFASFTEEERDRYKFRNDTVKAAIMRNLGVAKRKLVDDEELERKMKGEELMKPHEIVDLLLRHNAQKESQDISRSRPDYSLVGELSAANIKRIGHDQGNGRGRGRMRGLRQISNRGRGEPHKPKMEEIPNRGRGHPRGRGRPDRGRGSHIRNIQTTPNQAKQAKEERMAWITDAKQIVGEGCFKCGKQGHGSKQCMKYKLITKTLCRRCKAGFHSEQACASRGQNQPWGGNTTQSQRGRDGPARATWRQGQPTRQWQQRGGYKPFGRGAATQQNASRGRGMFRGAFRGHGMARGAISRITQEEYKRNLTWKARQVATGANLQSKVKRENSQQQEKQNRGGNNSRGRGNTTVYNPFLTSGQRIQTVSAQDATDAYMEALNQGQG